MGISTIRAIKAVTTTTKTMVVVYYLKTTHVNVIAIKTPIIFYPPILIYRWGASLVCMTALARYSCWTPAFVSYS